MNAPLNPTRLPDEASDVTAEIAPVAPAADEFREAPRKRRPKRDVDGWVLLDKPVGMLQRAGRVIGDPDARRDHRGGQRMLGKEFAHIPGQRGDFGRALGIGGLGAQHGCG